MTPELQASLISFLVQTGVFAMNELKERWRVSRMDKNDEIDLSSPKKDKDFSPLVDYVSDVHSDQYIKQKLQLLEGKHNNIYRWIRTKDLDKLEQIEGNRSLAQVQNHGESLDSYIRTTMSEINSLLSELGLVVERDLLIDEQ